MAKELDKNKVNMFKELVKTLLQDTNKCIDQVNESVSELLQGINTDNYGTVGSKDHKHIVNHSKQLRNLSEQTEILHSTLDFIYRKL